MRGKLVSSCLESIGIYERIYILSSTDLVYLYMHIHNHNSSNNGLAYYPVNIACCTSLLTYYFTFYLMTSGSGFSCFLLSYFMNFITS